MAAGYGMKVRFYRTLDRQSELRAILLTARAEMATASEQKCVRALMLYKANQLEKFVAYNHDAIDTRTHTHALKNNPC